MAITKPVKPNTFVGGTQAIADEANENFDILYSKSGEVIDNVNAAAGSKTTLAGRLGVALNADGTLKTTVTAGGEWLDPDLSPTYVAAAQFSVGGNHTDIYLALRRLKVTLAASTVYTSVVSSVYSAGTGLTTVTVAGDVLTNPITAVEHSIVRPVASDGAVSAEMVDAYTKAEVYAKTEVYAKAEGDVRYGRLDQENVWLEPQTVPNATADGHALNRVSGDAKYAARGSGGDLPNGDFEMGDAGSVPHWTLTAYTGGSVARATDDSSDGAAALKMIHPGGAGNGGGYAESQMVPCSPLVSETVSFCWRVTNAALNVRAVAWFYDRAGALLSGTELLNTTGGLLTTWRRHIAIFTPPAGAAWMILGLYGGEPPNANAGAIYFDDITRTPSPGSMFDRMPARAVTSLAEGSQDWFNVGNFLDRRTFAVFPPFSTATVGSPLYISVTVALRAAGPGADGYARLRLGDSVSNAVGPINHTAYVHYQFTIDASAGRFVVPPGGWVNVVLQGYSLVTGWNMLSQINAQHPLCGLNL